MTRSHDKFSYQGRVLQTRLIKAEDPTLAYVQVEVEFGHPGQAGPQTINCLMARKALSFLMRVQEGTRLKIYGHYNHRQQFIIESYQVLERTPEDHPLPPHLFYPKRKKY